MLVYIGVAKTLSSTSINAVCVPMFFANHSSGSKNSSRTGMAISILFSRVNSCFEFAPRILAALPGVMNNDGWKPREDVYDNFHSSVSEMEV